MSKNIPIDLSVYETVIFDLGKVIIDLYPEATTEAFKTILGKEYSFVIERLNKAHHFTDYETGRISTADFIKGIQSSTSISVDESEIKQAWNAMLGKIPDSRLKLLKEVKESHQTFCLSNTNELHIEFIYDYLSSEKQLQNLDDYFKSVYLSHEINMRKPDKEIFQWVIDQNKLNPQKTIFIDDTAGHLEGAKACGLNTFHFSDGIILEDLIIP